jgi:hypothetical protein
MADFEPKFVDLVRNTTMTVGTGDFTLGAAVAGYTSIAAACQVGDSFYYSAIGVGKPAEREVGRGTLLADGIVSRDPVNGVKTDFTAGIKSIALIAAAEWFDTAQELVASVTPAGRALVASADTAAARNTLGLGTAALEAVSRFPIAVADRAALAVFSASSTAFLREAGREGTFVWDSSNLSAKVTSDSLQGVYVAPVSDATGASGAWVRKFSGALNVKWFGAVGNGATDDYPAIQGALNLLRYTGGEVFVPPIASQYRCSAGLVIYAGTHLHGGIAFQDSTAGSHPAADIGSTILFDTNVPGLLVKYVNDDDTSGGPIIYPGGHHSLIERLRLYSANQGAASAACIGIESRTVVSVRDVIVQGFGGHGVLIRGSLAGSGGSDGVVYGNASSSNLWHVTANGSAGDGFHIEGSDANCCVLSNCKGIGNLGWDFYDNALITNVYIGCLSHSGGLGSFKSARSNVPHTFIGCHSEGAVADLKQGCTVLGGSLGQPGMHLAGSLAHVMSGGISYRYPFQQISDSYGGVSVGITLGTKNADGAVLTLGRGGNYANWKLRADPPGSIGASWGLNYGGSSVCTPICWPDGDSRTGRAYAPEFPRGICIGDQTNNAGSRDKLIITGTAAPTTGTWQQGDLVINRAPTAGGTWAWVCTAGGTPGTWSALTTAYSTGAGGTIIQATSKSTGVTLNKLCGQVTMSAAALAAAAIVEFTVTNSQVAATDTINLNLASGAATSTAYRYWVSGVAAGSFKVSVENRSGGSLSEALVLNFAVVKAVSA